MDNLLVLFLETYATEEQEKLSLAGVRTLRIDALNGVFSEAESKLKGFEVLIRGPKLTPTTYGELCEGLLTKGVTLRTLPSSYAALSSSDVYEESIKDFVPEMLSLDMSSPILVEEISHLKDWDQVFLRSELGSAAKFGGIDSCFVRSFDRAQIEERLDVLKRAHPTARRVVARRVEEVRKIDGKSVEGRFLVLNGFVRYLDHFESEDTVEKKLFESRHLISAATIADRLLQAGVGGDYFVDIAERQSGGWFVVEIKPLLNGTIRDTSAFANALQTATPERRG